MQHLAPFAPTRSLERIETRLARRTRTRRLVIALSAGVVALLALLPAAGQAQMQTAPADSLAPAPGSTMPPAPAASPAPAPSVAPTPVPGTSPAPPAAAPMPMPAPVVTAPAQPSPPLTVPPPPPPTNAMVQKTAGAVTYICGGVADDEQRALSAQSRNYNMGLLFTQGARGEYLSDVTVKLMRGSREVASFVADGPRCLVRAPQGTYNVRATYEGRTKTMVVSTGTHNAQMRW